MSEMNCSNCKYQKGIFKHPWNKQEWAKGDCNELIAYGCSIEDITDRNGAIVLMESDTGRCEMHEFDADVAEPEETHL
jgi:hypothetical protein